MNSQKRSIKPISQIKEDIFTLIEKYPYAEGRESFQENLMEFSDTKDFKGMCGYLKSFYLGLTSDKKVQNFLSYKRDFVGDLQSFEISLFLFNYTLRNFISLHFPFDGPMKEQTIKTIQYWITRRDYEAISSYLHNCNLENFLSLRASSIADMSTQELLLLQSTCKKIVKYKDGCEKYYQRIQKLL